MSSNLKWKCAFCCKKINITNSFECDCKEMFCSKHRYAESHQCTDIKQRQTRDIERLKQSLVKMEIEKISII